MRNKRLHQLYEEHTGKVSDKWSLYLSEYDRLFEDYRDEPIRLLEIGIQNGGSLEIWSKYFNNASALIGCDINPDCARLSYEDPCIGVIVGDANAPDVRERVFQLSPEFDIIIDDGSHLSSDIIKSFLLYFSRIVEGGVFIVEDLHCSYWKQFEGGLFDPYSSISFFKRLVDVISHEHWGIPKARADILRGFSAKYGCEIDADVLSQVHSVEFINSICVVRKAPSADNGLGRRVIAGSMELVVSGHRKLHDSIYQFDTAYDQARNPWTARTTPPDEAIENTEQALYIARQQIANLSHAVAERDGQIANLSHAVAERDGQIANLSHAVAERDGQISAIYNSTSWRMTWPLRVVGHQLKRVLRVAELAKPAIQRGGGLRRTLKKAMELYRSEGFIGIKRGLRIVAVSRQISPLPGSDGFDRNDYSEWIRRYDTLTEETRATMRTRIDAFAHKPVISIVMPTYNPKTEWLIEAIESVRKQIYPYWELCIADDASPDQSIRQILEQYAHSDARIKVVVREENGHISASSNSALTLATGAWVALLDHDDLLAEQALFYLADEINRHPDARLIYSDEDKISEEGHRFNPYFKPDWNVDLFYSQNLFSHLGAYDLALVNQVGGFRLGLEGSQDYDLALRCIERIKSSQIRHIPHVLYHWRMHAESTASSNSAKPYAVVAGERALNDHFKRLSVNATAESFAAGYRVNYQLPPIPPLVSLIIYFNNSPQSLLRCIKSVRSNTHYKKYEIIIIPTSSSDIEVALLKRSIKDEMLDVVLPENLDISLNSLDAAVNQAQGDIICFLSSSTEVISADWLTEMVSLVVQPKIGVVGAKLLDASNGVYSGGLLLNPVEPDFSSHAHQGIHCQDHGYFGRASLRQNYSAVSALCMVVKKEMYFSAGGMDDKNIDASISWIDFCLRIQENGFRIVWTPFSILRVHHVAAISDAGKDGFQKYEAVSSSSLFKSRWSSLLNKDPSNTLNLSNSCGDFSLAWPPRVN